MKKQSNNKINFLIPIIISVAIILVIVIACVIIVNVHTKSIENEIQEAIKSGALEKDYTTLMKLSKELIGEDILLEDIDNKISGKEDQLELYVGEESGYIADKTTNEKITFTIIKEEDDAPERLQDFIYHETIQGNDTFLMKSSENTFQHFNGYITNEFDNIDEAIRDHLIVRE